MCKLHDTASCMIAALTNLHSVTTLPDSALVLLDSLPLVLLEHLPQEGLPLLSGSCGPLLETVPEGFDPCQNRFPLGGAQLLEMSLLALDILAEPALVLLGLLKGFTLELAPPATSLLVVLGFQLLGFALDSLHRCTDLRLNPGKNRPHLGLSNLLSFGLHHGNMGLHLGNNAFGFCLYLGLDGVDFSPGLGHVFLHPMFDACNLLPGKGKGFLEEATTTAPPPSPAGPGAGLIQCNCCPAAAASFGAASATTTTGKPGACLALEPH